MKREHDTPGRTLAAAVVLLLLLSGTSVEGKETTWWELRDLPLESLTLAPTTAERLAKATVILVSAGALHPSGNGYDMDVRAWTEVQVQGDVGSQPFCQPLDNLDLLFYGQSELAVSTCSAFLVAPDLVITAGHCIDTPDCTDKYAVFDFADQGPPPPGGLVHLTQDQVRRCEEVLVDTFPGTADLPTEPKGGLDWALLRLEEPVDPSQRTPLALDRFSPIEADDTMLVMGYPNGLSLKTEVVEHRPGAALIVLAHVLTGNSGSPIFNLETGKASQVLSTAGDSWVIQQPGPPACHDPCFECDGVGAGGNRTSILASPELPILGLQIDTAGSGSLVQYYGPPTIGADFDTWSVTVSVEDPLEPLAEVSWAMVEENPTGPPFLDVLEGSTSGSLMAGESETITVRPSDATVASPGLLQRIIPLFDYSFGTRDPITHEVYVGIDGYTVVPATEIAGEGLGVPDGTSQEFTLANRWIVPQNVELSWAADWITLDGSSVPVTVTLPGKYSRAPLPVPVALVDGALIAPDGAQVLFKGFGDRLQGQSLFDQDNLEYWPPTGNLNTFDGLLSAGDWTLKLVLSEEAEGLVTFRLDRLEVRLHHDTAPCN